MPALLIDGLAKSFTLHLQGGTVLPVLQGLAFVVEPGECVVLAGPSGQGKSTVLKLVYGSYRAVGGSILIHHDGEMVDLAHAGPRRILEVRRRTLGYVSQFLRVVPRISALNVVAEPLLAHGIDRDIARDRAGQMLARLNIPEPLWSLPPATFSGGEQQRINLARGFIHPYPVMLLDEPTASLDAANRAVVVELIAAAKGRGAALLGIFHDEDVRRQVATRIIDLAVLKAAA
jgi:alpha-D-ribose 1-methylphosphonate 5-triphosphate synthase subunit PhnL